MFNTARDRHGVQPLQQRRPWGRRGTTSRGPETRRHTRAILHDDRDVLSPVVHRAPLARSAQRGAQEPRRRAVGRRLRRRVHRLGARQLRRRRGSRARILPDAPRG